MRELFDYLIQYGGKIISSNELQSHWINQAMASNRMWVDDNGFGFIWEPNIEKMPETIEEVKEFEKWYPIEMELPATLKNINLK